MPTYENKVQQGTNLVWKKTGGGYAITLAGIANNAARQGVKGDLGAKFARVWSVTLQINLDAAPAAGNLIELFWAPSHDNTTFPGGADGTDSPYMADEVDEWKKQLWRIGSLPVTADADAAIQTKVFSFQPPTRYGAPVVVNKSGQAFENDDDAHRITFTPLVPVIDAV